MKDISPSPTFLHDYASRERVIEHATTMTATPKACKSTWTLGHPECPAAPVLYYSLPGLFFCSAPRPSRRGAARKLNHNLNNMMTFSSKPGEPLPFLGHDTSRGCGSEPLLGPTLDPLSQRAMSHARVGPVISPNHCPLSTHPTTLSISPNLRDTGVQLGVMHSRRR